MRKDNILTLVDTLNTFEKGYYIFNGGRRNCKVTKEEMMHCHVYLPEDVEKVCQSKDISRVINLRKMVVGCYNIDSYSMARKIDLEKNINSKPVLVLNLANPVNPGGGVRRGAQAQEEDLCRKSSLLISLEGESAKSYYLFNQGYLTILGANSKHYSMMGSDAIIMIPKVEVIKDENGDYLEDSILVSVMTCAAPCLSYGMEGLSEKQYESMLYKRIVGMLKVAAYEGYEYLVLGAFGCGAFDNDAHLVSDLFYKALKEFNFNGMRAESFFRRIDFAVLDRTSKQYNFNEFSRNFNHFYQEDKNFEQ